MIPALTHCSSFGPWISITGDRNKLAILAVKKKKKKKTNLVFFCEKYINDTQSGQFVCKTATSFRLFFDYNYATQMRHAAFSISVVTIFHFVKLSSAYTVRTYIWRKWVLMSLQTVKCHMIVQMRRSGRKRRPSGDDDSDGGPGAIFRSNSTGTWPSRGVSTLFTLVSQWNHDISSCSHQKLQHYSTKIDIYACCFGFQARTVWPERFHQWNLQKRVDRRDWPLNLVLCFRSSPSENIACARGG